ncbi:uncharacterized protein LOC131693232 [Topomyia yanbarensis]|uniref:uncharacterized protein LOC131693232 n=1 Tax=Topomyia yanbarensis TaxID=2498891 RepID=UPI00273BC627|nr:uncharacterized protein LOC131693232 [Topomyia yanbarensis]XP_058836874.1 uncharacterized protein LOC131693232 [Topomyia yanbarensis]XP_058836875.1 uncharacterized protein LOC131693232 [Topomyia yanbarensis]
MVGCLSNVGILAVEIIFPSQYVEQTELEIYDGVSAGKYTIGLGQSRMGFCSDREDVNSLCLTVVNNLLDRHKIARSRIGRLEVGTETVVDKSKSVKTVLMQLFEKDGPTNLEGIDTKNACYGGTAALFNALDWIESSSCKGRLAIVVCADIAVYAQGSARPTGGAGAVAMLVGPNAPLVIDRGLRATYMKHAYDFYKPDLSSEYPVVDGKLSIQCYLSALDNCYQLYRKKFADANPSASPVNLDFFDALIFHTPYCKLVQKSLARLGLNDFVLTPADQRATVYPAFDQFMDVKLEETYFDRDVEKAFMAHFTPVFNTKTKPSLHLANQVGNMYTPSVYSGLVSLLINSDISELKGKKVGVFSYGSGLASTMYSISITSDVQALTSLKSYLNYVQPLLDSRNKVTPEDFTKMMEIREANNHAAPYEPSGSVETLFPGTYYLASVDKMHRRSYERVPIATSGQQAELNNVAESNHVMETKTTEEWLPDVGILALEIIFPSQYVDQTELEVFDGVSAGKYTIGLGQSRMGFSSDREDVNSLCLTVVHNLLERHQIPYSRIGRLEVGTETLVDKSKSVKSVLMQLFESKHVTDVEGIDTTNACYGGTAALFNALNWVESSSSKGRLALVVCADIAVYAQGTARPTGGAGAVAMLIGPNAPLTIDRGLRATFMKHAYDFYKPDLTSEYPVVDGKLSIQCYLSALDNCYQLYKQQFVEQNPTTVDAIDLNIFDAIIFHTPYCKLVQKSFARLGLNDFIQTPADQRLTKFSGFEKFQNVSLEDTYFDRDVEKAFMTHYTPLFNSKTKPSLHLANQVGNMYTPSVYGGLVSLLISNDVAELAGRKVGVFSYGSGLASSMYSISITSDVEAVATFKNKLSYVQPLLDARIKVSPEEFTRLMEIREKNNHAAPYEPTGQVDVLFPGTYYLKQVDNMHRRVYERVTRSSSNTNCIS